MTIKSWMMEVGSAVLVIVIAGLIVLGCVAAYQHEVATDYIIVDYRGEQHRCTYYTLVDGIANFTNDHGKPAHVRPMEIREVDADSAHLVVLPPLQIPR